MKRIMFSKVILAFVSILCLGSSCSSGDGEDGNAEIKDPIYPNSKSLNLSKMLLDETYNDKDTIKYNDYYAPFIIGADYDELGRLTKVFSSEPFLNKKQKMNYKTIATIDYDLKIIEVLKQFDFPSSKKDDYMLQFDFKINDHGCFSRISDVSFKYDSEGYLISAKRSPSWGLSLSYNDNNLVSSILERLPDVFNYSCNYSNEAKSGDLIMSLTYPEYNLSIRNEFRAPGHIACYIAYFAGMFGNTIKFFHQLSRFEENSVRIHLLYNNSDYLGLHFNLEYE